MFTVFHDSLGVRFTDFRSASVDECRAFIEARRSSPVRSVRSIAAKYKIEDRAGNPYPVTVKRENRA